MATQMRQQLGKKVQSPFEIYLRTGRRVAADPAPLEYKFNPYHDPQNGQFTFAPG